MSEEKVFEVAGVETIEKPLEDGGSIKYPKPKEKKKRKPMTDEQREAMKLRLAKGRETALKNRQKKALVKKIDREDKEKEMDEKIAKKVLQKDTRDEEIESLKNELNSLKQKSTNDNSNEIEKMTKNMFLLGKTVDHLLEENRNYKKRKEEKKKKKEEELEIKKKEEEEKKKVEEEKKVEIPEPKVFNSGKYRNGLNLKGLL